MLPLILLLVASVAQGQEVETDNSVNGNENYNPQFIYPQERTSVDHYGPGEPVATGPWVTVPNGYQPDLTRQGSGNPFGLDISGGLGFDSQSLVTWGLGAVIMLLLVSTFIQLMSKMWPFGKELRDLMYEVTAESEGRSLEQVSTLAQFALEAMQKYEDLNALKEA